MPPEDRPLLARARHFYARIERPFSSLSLIGGFVFDALTLRRVDLFWENFWVVAHLAIVTACALIINLKENSGSDESDPEKLHFWLVNIMQFFFGGIFSTYLVFYFRSGTIATSWPFLILLAAAFIANERLKRHYARLAFQLSLLFISYYAFAIYLMPILFHQISMQVFLVSGAVSLAAIGGIITLLKKFTRERFVGRAKWIARGAIGAIFITINVLYFANLIPPLPLSLKAGEIYQSLVANGPGDYTVQHDDRSGWLGIGHFFAWSETVQIAPGAPLYAYTAIFSPAAFQATVVHEWQHYDEPRSAWITQARVNLQVSGGADGGWRTYSELPNVAPGAWRVNVKTTQGQIIGQLRFDVMVASTPVQLLTNDLQALQ